jgi:hypothetical protein
MSESTGEHRVLIFVGLFLLIFFALIASLATYPNEIIFAEQEGLGYQTYYPSYTPPDRWQFRDLEYGEINAYEDLNLDYPERYLTVNVSAVIDYVEWGYVLGVMNYQSVTIHFSKGTSVKYTAVRDYIISLQQEENGQNVSMVYLDHITTEYSIRLSFSYDNETYTNFLQAWTAGHLIILIEVYVIEAQSVGFNLWTLLGQILLFQSPDIGLSVLNIFIAIPIYLGLAVCALYVINKLRDMLPDWL